MDLCYYQPLGQLQRECPFASQGADKSQIDAVDLGAFPAAEKSLSFKVFVTTFLGFGANEAMSRHRRHLVLSQVRKSRKQRSYFCVKFSRVTNKLLKRTTRLVDVS